MLCMRTCHIFTTSTNPKYPVWSTLNCRILLFDMFFFWICLRSTSTTANMEVHLTHLSTMKTVKMYIICITIWYEILLQWSTVLVEIKVKVYTIYYCMIIIHVLLFKWWVCKQRVCSTIERMGFFCSDEQTNERAIYIGVHWLYACMVKATANGWTEAENNKEEYEKYVAHMKLYDIFCFYFDRLKTVLATTASTKRNSRRQFKWQQ